MDTGHIKRKPYTTTMARSFGPGVLLLSFFAGQASARWNTTESWEMLQCYRYGRHGGYFSEGEGLSYRDSSPYFDHYDYESKQQTRFECEDATSATGGSYTTMSKMCVVSFHKSSNSNHGAYKLSDVCDDENELERISSLVNRFPDSCVGQFPRCYELQTQSIVFAKLLCAKGGQVPPGTTHVSVDCRADAAESEKKYEEYKKSRDLEDKLKMAFGIGIPVLLLLCCAGACFRYRLKLRSFATSCPGKWKGTSNSKGHDDWTICSVMCCGILFVMKRLHKTPEMSGLLARGEDIQLTPVDGHISRRLATSEVA